jgi:phytanoyl-CoA hydroxylase
MASSSSRLQEPEEIAALRARAAQIVNDFDPAAQSGIFSTIEQEKTTDDYFLGSDNTIRCFFEEEAFGPDGQLKQAKELSINKIGHAMHDLDPAFRAFTADARLERWRASWAWRSEGLAIDVHLQAARHRRRSALAPGRHLLRHRSRQRHHLLVRAGRRHAGQRLHVGRTGRPSRPDARALPAQWRRRAHGKTERPAWPDNSTAVPLECKAGSLVCFHGLLPHYSAPNRSPVSRHAYTLHVTDGATRYSPQNWIQRDDKLPVRGFL